MERVKPNKTKVLIIEDDPDLQKLNRLIFERHQRYEVFVAETIEIAIDRFGYDFDIVLCDHLTGGAYSTEAYKILVAQGGRPKQFWIVTGAASLVGELPAGITGIIEKPAHEKLMAIADGRPVMPNKVGRLIA